jgi:hypothetical protein
MKLTFKGLTLFYGEHSKNVHRFLSAHCNDLFDNSKFKPFPSYPIVIDDETKSFLKKLERRWNSWKKDKIVIVGRDIDCGLHPKEQFDLANLISKFVVKGCKFAITSYNLYFLRALEYCIAKRVSEKELRKLFNIYIVDSEKTAKSYNYDKLQDIFKEYADAFDKVKELKFKKGEK